MTARRGAQDERRGEGSGCRRSQESRDGRGLRRQDIAFAFQVREAQIRRRSFHPIARVFGSDQRVVAAKNELHRHRERGELVMGPNRKRLHARTKVLGSGTPKGVPYVITLRRQTHVTYPTHPTYQTHPTYL